MRDGPQQRETIGEKKGEYWEQKQENNSELLRGFFFFLQQAASKEYK